MKRFLLTIFAIFLLGLTVFFGWTFVDRCRMPFNSEGNYFDEIAGIVYHEQSVLVYGLLTMMLLIFTAFTGFFARKTYHE